MSSPEPGRKRWAVSVAMAVYNGAKYIQAQLESLAQQTLLPIELVITDDGSTDDTLRIVESFASTAPFPIRFFRNEQNLGYANNFMKAALLCTGELISFCDQDDVWLPNKLEQCAATFNDPEVLLCVHSAELWQGAERCGQRCPGYDERRSIAPLGIHPLQSSYGFAMVIRRSLLAIADNDRRFQKALPPALPMPHDQWCWFLASVFGKIVLLPDVLVLYRQHGANVFGGVSGGQGLSGALAARDYAGAAREEDSAAAFLRDLSTRCAPELKSQASAGAELMSLSARINSARAKLYQDRLSFLQRLLLFSSVLVRDRYAVNVPGARLGLRAAAKDLVFAVLLHRQSA